jgi:hypothetical protein
VQSAAKINISDGSSTERIVTIAGTKEMVLFQNLIENLLQKKKYLIFVLPKRYIRRTEWQNPVKILF